MKYEDMSFFFEGFIFLFVDVSIKYYLLKILHVFHLHSFNAIWNTLSFPNMFTIKI